MTSRETVTVAPEDIRVSRVNATRGSGSGTCFTRSNNDRELPVRLLGTTEEEEAAAVGIPKSAGTGHSKPAKPSETTFIHYCLHAA